MRNDAVYLHHILDATNRIQEYLSGVSYDQFLQNSLLQDGVVRQFGIIGEAARNVSNAFRDVHPEGPWRRMGNIRNRSIHAYFNVDLPTVWDTTRSNLPPLRQQIEHILAEIVRSNP